MPERTSRELIPSVPARPRPSGEFSLSEPVSPSSLRRTARLVGLALGHEAAFVDAGASTQPGTRIRIARAFGADPFFCGDRDSDDCDRSAHTVILEQDAARAFAVLPLLDPSSFAAGSPLDDAAESGHPLALYVLSDLPREWTERERVALVDVASSLGAEVAARRELAESRVAGEELRRHTMRDALTELPNRALFLDRLGHAVERGRRHKDFRFAVLLLDLDRFKTVNDSLGVQVGDELLTTVARRLETCVRGEDTIARLSGDEYAILLESLANDSDAGRVADRMLRALAAPVETREGELFATASIGIVLGSSALDGLDALADAEARLLQRAGVAMSRAKASGGGRYEMFDREMQARAVARLRMETDLRAAVERREFEIYYQPLVSLESGRITEFEALLRWNHPERGMVAPLDFIPLAEETGLITPIGTWVLATACRQTYEWQQRFPRAEPLALSVNLSVKQFAQPHFVRHVSDTVRASGLDPSCLKLEITESIAIDDPERTRGMLEELRNLGVRMYLDDFGTGYSSLGHLHQLSLDAIKIDRSFVMRMDEPMHLQLVRTVRDLARNIGVIIIAEGVETTAQLQMLRELGCECAQGYLFSRPVPVAEVERLLERDPRW
jgi:diguanylate cyclase (GGDEF)-like protein